MPYDSAHCLVDCSGGLLAIPLLPTQALQGGGGGGGGGKEGGQVMGKLEGGGA